MKKEAVPHILSKLPDNLVQGYQQEACEYEQTTCLGHQPEKVMELTSDAPPPRLVDSAKDSIDKESSPEGKYSPLRKLPEGEEMRLGLSPGSEGEPVESGPGTKSKRLSPSANQHRKAHREPLRETAAERARSAGAKPKRLPLWDIQKTLGRGDYRGISARGTRVRADHMPGTSA